MDRIDVNRNDKRLTTPRSAAIAGVISGGLFLVSFILIRIAFPDDPVNIPAWVKDQSHLISIALQMVPFAGIAYLWFMGVARDRLGKREDQFFATVFLGSGLLYLAMTFVGTALGAGLLAIYAQDASILGSTIYSYNLVVINQIINIYSLRMAAVFICRTNTKEIVLFTRGHMTTTRRSAGIATHPGRIRRAPPTIWPTSGIASAPTSAATAPTSTGT